MAGALQMLEGQQNPRPRSKNQSVVIIYQCITQSSEVFVKLSFI